MVSLSSLLGLDRTLFTYKSPDGTEEKVTLRSWLGLDLELFSYRSADDIQSKNRQLMQKIKDDNPRYEPDLIISVYRGGHNAMRIACDHYFPGIVKEKKFYMICITSYTGIGETSNLVLTHPLPRREKVLGKNILLVEDLSDTGVSLAAELYHIYSRALDEMRQPINQMKGDPGNEGVYQNMEREHQRLSGRLQELKIALTVKDKEKRIEATKEVMKTGLQSEFEKYVNVNVAAAYIKPWTISIPDFWVELIPAWIMNAYEEQEMTKSIMDNKKLTSRQKRRTLLRTGISVRMLNQYLKNFHRDVKLETGEDDPRYRELTPREKYLECPYFRILNRLQYSVKKHRESKKFKIEHLELF